MPEENSNTPNPPVPNTPADTAQPVADSPVQPLVPEPSKPKVSNPTSLKFRGAKKTLIIIGVILFLLLAASVATYFLVFKNQTAQPSPLGSPEPSAEAADPTADWKIYTDSKLGFQIKYPDDWEGLQSSCALIQITHTKSTELSLYNFIKSRGYSESTNIEELIKQTDDQFNIDFKNIPKSDIAIIGSEGEGSLNTIYIKSPTGYYFISVTYNGPIPDTNRQCLDSESNEYKQILSTFKFIDDATTD